jgi:hypothetical protein
MWAALAVIVGVSMYLVKYKVQALEEELAGKRDQITRDRGAIRVLEAEWTYLNDPGRLRRLSSQYLGLRPALPENITDIDALPMRPAGNGGTVSAPADDTMTGPGPAPATGRVFHAANSPEKDPFATPRPAGLPVLVARLQRLLFPDAVGATISKEGPR